MGHAGVQGMNAVIDIVREVAARHGWEVYVWPGWGYVGLRYALDPQVWLTVTFDGVVSYRMEGETADDLRGPTALLIGAEIESALSKKSDKPAADGHDYPIGSKD